MASPEASAESVIIFLPTVDISLESGAQDIYLKGRIVKVERGKAPGAIIRHADTMRAAHPAGIPVRMFLMRAPDRDAYYPVAVHSLKDDPLALAAVAAMSQPANAPVISVSVTSPLGNPVYAAPLNGVPYDFGAKITIPAGGPPLKADLYFGFMRREGRQAYTWDSDAGVPVIKTGMTPLMKDIGLGTAATIDLEQIFGGDIEYEFIGDEPTGVYLVFAMLVLAGTSPSQPINWIAAEMTPLFVD
ncbi:MAG: hypothetical protein RLZZ227_1683 [Pseudomonadota bacterium]